MSNKVSQVSTQHPLTPPPSFSSMYILDVNLCVSEVVVRLLELGGGVCALSSGLATQVTDILALGGFGKVERPAMANLLQICPTVHPSFWIWQSVQERFP